MQGGAPSDPRRRNWPVRRCFLGRLAVDEQRLGAVFDDVLVDHHLHHAVEAGQFEHGVDQRVLHDRAQATGAGLACQCLAGDGRQGRRANFEFDAFHAEAVSGTA
jgi:hypothetical protein